MIGKFLMGTAMGGLVGSGVLAVISVVAPGPQLAAPPAPAEAVVDGASEAAAPSVAERPAEEPVAEEPVAEEPVAEELAAPDLAAPDLAEQDLPAQGLAEGEAPLAEAPATPESVAELPPAEPAAPAETGPALAEPAEAPSVVTTPSAPPALAPALESDAAPAPSESPEGPAPAAGAEPPEPLAATAELNAAPAPKALPEPLGETPAAQDGPAQPLAPQAEAAPAPATEAPLPPLTPEEQDMLARIAEEGPEAAMPLEEPSAPVDTDMPLAERPSTLAPTPALRGSADAVTTDRLPRVGDAPAQAVEEEAAALADSRPVALYAAPFENPEGKPLFAILVIDEGKPETDRAALAALPFPVSFALDPSDPNAAVYAEIYRAAGREVVMLASALPKGGQATDIEVALSVMSQALPEAVAVMDLPSRAFQADRPLATLVVPVIGAAGRGLVTWDQGLNAADQVARREDIPAATAFRDLDGADESAPVIRRYLDRAAFKAAQEGRVTVVGRSRPETVAALLEWAIEGRAATVALAPLTAVLSAD
ncbi:divergent polysaccharide deacetylase family protein [Xinfangfangia sp. CPCC 101601]|uniref:Divergent polysaccharide deacetylase family protein n=1 Tax=Pseudogemmobacter lacusdianii TaxID=3069608 RepID=A0ABU0W2A4_9RHOB|nr:divergent polysaccharide deacetylase family protein [Xinfangfangia sp. CPCC 101601]MDQ2067555.1 divergent polysaccharide deacetylase family protein [Xinfangfangia sp. CPCC 101601]